MISDLEIQLFNVLEICLVRISQNCKKKIKVCLKVHNDKKNQNFIDCLKRIDICQSMSKYVNCLIWSHINVKLLVQFLALRFVTRQPRPHSGS